MVIGLLEFKRFQMFQWFQSFHTLRCVQSLAAVQVLKGSKVQGQTRKGAFHADKRFCFALSSVFIAGIC